MKIDGIEIGSQSAPYIIAEASCNHGGSLDMAMLLIDKAAKAGADAIKFQAYTADTITIDCDSDDFIIKDGPWKGRKLYELYSKTQTPFEWFPRLFERARLRSVACFASVFDRSSVDVLERVGCPAYKIASFEILDTPLIKYAARTGKPLIISTGMASDKEVDNAVLAAAQTRGGIAALHCVSGYPTPLYQANLRRFRSLQFIWQALDAVGISDHTTGIEVPIAATALGAQIIEKHFTIRHDTEDAAFSLMPAEFTDMVNAVDNIWAACNTKPGSSSEDAHRGLRRSLYAVADVENGEPFTRENVRSIRPGNGLPPEKIEEVVKRKAAIAIKRGTPLKLGHLQD